LYEKAVVLLIQRHSNQFQQVLSKFFPFSFFYNNLFKSFAVVDNIGIPSFPVARDES
jgi:hypothetical protein